MRSVEHTLRGMFCGLLLSSLSVFADEIGPSDCGYPVIIRGDVNHWRSGQTVVGASDQSMYEEEIWKDNFTVVVEGIPADVYSVEVYLAEHYATAVGQRVFSISSGGMVLVNDLDIFAVAGQNVAHVETFNVSLSSGDLELLFSASVNNAKLNALVVKDSSGTSVACLKAQDLVDYVPAGNMGDTSSFDVVNNMGVGINLGNTLDTRAENKTWWGNPETTEAIIDGILSRGFGTLRIPVTWEYDMDASYTIQSSYLDRVEEIVNWALDNDVYVILNTHHDGDWIIPTYAEIDTVTNHLYTVWSQIAERFKNYGDHLIFETLNEPRVEGGGSEWGEWSGGTPETRDCVNIANKACVDAIRATGGNNTLRKIMCPTHGASAGSTAMAAWVAPNDDPNILVSIHAYSPYWFCLTDQDPDWGTESDQQDLDNLFDTIYNTLIVGKGRAVVMGEWGEQDNGLGNEADRSRHAQYYAKACIEHGICPVYWDDGGKFKVYERRSLAWHAPEHADAILSPFFGVPFALYELTSELQFGRTGDDDGDGVNNLVEFAIGGDATDASVRGVMPRVDVSNGQIVFVSHQRIDRAKTGLSYTLEWCDNLVSNSWGPLISDFTLTNAVADVEDVEEIRQGFQRSGDESSSGFFRMRVGE